MSFESLQLIPSLLTILDKQGYTTPTPIQEKAITPILEGKDVMAAAQTGTGKTAAFSLPMLQLLSNSKQQAKANHTRALVLTPTRELAAQVAESVSVYGQGLDLKYNLVFGGVKINPQMMKLRKGTDILIATPGRLLDLFQQNAIKFNQIEMLVLDEADRMLDMGFIKDVKKILSLLPKNRQSLLFSATFSEEIRTLARTLLKEPVEVSVTPPNTTVEIIEQHVYPVDKTKKTALLTHLIKTENWFQLLVFCRTKHGANRVTKSLNKQGISAAAIHGNKSQNVRTRALADFKDKSIQVLVATDIAARGIDITDLPYVINYDLPHVAEDYVHRIGRTGRAGKAGKAMSLVCAEESKQLLGIERLINMKIEQQIIPGFKPIEPLLTKNFKQPASKNNSANNKPRRNRSTRNRAVK